MDIFHLKRKVVRGHGQVQSSMLINNNNKAGVILLSTKCECVSPSLDTKVDLNHTRLRLYGPFSQETSDFNHRCK